MLQRSCATAPILAASPLCRYATYPSGHPWAIRVVHDFRDQRVTSDRDAVTIAAPALAAARCTWEAAGMACTPNGSEPIIIVLNGAPSSGKTSTARAMQHLAAIPLIRIGIDDLFAACPEPWAAADAGPHSFDGFRYVQAAGGSTRIIPGPVGEAMIRAYHRSIAAYAQAGFSVVVDDLLLSERDYPDWLAVLADRRHLLVGLICPIDVLEERDQRRRRRVAGLARGHLDSVHAGVKYDLEYDTSTLSPQHLARAILTAAGCPLEPAR